MADLDIIWLYFDYNFSIVGDQNCSNRHHDNNELHIISNGLQKFNLFEYMELILQKEINRNVRHKLCTNFWNDGNITSNQVLLFEKYNSTVNNAHNDFQHLVQFITRWHMMKRVDTYSIGDMEKWNLMKTIREVIIFQTPGSFKKIVQAFYDISFRKFLNTHLKNDIAEEHNFSQSPTKFCDVCRKQFNQCCCSNSLKNIANINGKMQVMQLLDRVIGCTITSLVQIRLNEFIRNACEGLFDRSHIKYLEEWIKNIIYNWLENTLIETDKRKDLSAIECFDIKLKYLLYESFAHSIIKQMFNIIIDFPDSIPALDDLKICLEKIDVRKFITNNIKRTIEKKILHPGVNTMDIVTAYISTIKSIRYLDTSGIILESVLDPIKIYLRKRTDTVRRVVTSLTEQSPTDLSEELVKSEIADSAAKDLNIWDAWTPEPQSFEFVYKNKIKNQSGSFDIIAMVMDIYGTKEIFMNEYRNLMGDRLLKQLEFIPEKEIRNLELLKHRFGEALLHSCEVMLKDVSDSKRINAHINANSPYQNSKVFDISALIISAQYWPNFNKENLELPDEIAKEFKKFTSSYEGYKGNRTLNWRYVTGRVNIAIEIGDQFFDLTVPPIQAVIIYHFQHKNKWSLENLAAVMKITTTILRRRMHFWKIFGLIQEIEPDVYQLIESGINKSGTKMDDTDLQSIDDEDIDSVMLTVTEQREEDLQVFWSYIVGMLTNLDSLSLERIHQMLKLFASQGMGIEFSQEELKVFLQRKVREHKLIYTNGVFQLSK